MSVLHIVNHAEALSRCLEIAADNDAVVLIEDGVYAGATYDSRALYALEDDLAARGMSARMMDTVTTIDYAKFVELVCEHQPTVSWR